MEIKVSDLVVGYGKSPILNPITFELQPGSACLVIGQNGVGKTSLLRTIVGLQPALGGRVQVGDSVIAPNILPRLIPAGVRFLGQGDRGFPLLRASSHRRVLARLFGFRSAPSVLFSKDSNRRIGSMSVGQRRMEAIGLMDCEPVKLFILDEPTASLDPDKRVAIKDWIKRSIDRGKSFLVVEHDYRFFSGVFDKLMILKSPDVVYFGDSLPTDEIIRLVS